MENGHSRISMNVLLWMLIWSMLEFRGGFGIRFVIDKSECLTHDVKYEGDTVHVSFVVVKSDGYWHYGDDGVDLVNRYLAAFVWLLDKDLEKYHTVMASNGENLNFKKVDKWYKIKGPSGEQIHDFHDKSIDIYEFLAQRKGLYQFCFTSKSPYRETIDFDVHVGHFMNYDQHAKDEHFNPMLEQISKLEEALYNIQFEQHWLEAQTDRQALLNEAMSQRAVYKAIFESLALLGISFLQVYLLQRLFERKLGTSRV